MYSSARNIILRTTSSAFNMKNSNLCGQQFLVVDCGSGSSRINLVGRNKAGDIYTERLCKLPKLVSVLQDEKELEAFVKDIKRTAFEAETPIPSENIVVAATAGLRKAIEVGEISEYAPDKLKLLLEDISFLILDGKEEAKLELTGAQTLFNQVHRVSKAPKVASISMVSMGGRSMQFGCSSSGNLESMALSFFCIREFITDGQENQNTNIKQDVFKNKLQKSEQLIGDNVREIFKGKKLKGLVALIALAGIGASFAGLKGCMPIESALTKLDEELEKLKLLPAIDYLKTKEYPDGAINHAVFYILLRHVMNFAMDPCAEIYLFDDNMSNCDWWTVGLYTEKENVLV